MNVGNKSLYFAYDAGGQPMSILYDADTTDTTDGITYYYITNIQGDVIGIADGAGTQVVSYTYDAWGNHLSTTGTLANTLGQINPLRYRGYVYDNETELYYLQSRYYDPETGRFLNEDILISTGQGFIGCNMFVYCLNNPVNNYDINGKDAVWIQENDSAANMGHSGLLVQDEDGNWYFFYWGPIDEGESPFILCRGVTANCVLDGIDVNGGDLSTVAGVQAVFASDDNNFVRNRADLITGALYFEGNFSKTYEYLYDLYQAARDFPEDNQYNLLLNNCVQQSCRAMAESDGRFGSKAQLIPNVTYIDILNYYLNDSIVKLIRKQTGCRP